MVYALDKDGNIWLDHEGPDGHKVVVIADGEPDISVKKVFTQEDGVPGSVFFSMIQDDQGNIWFASQTDGLYMYDGENWRVYTAENGLFSNSISSVY